nr:alpha-amylase family glycosyl hydrolase [uncultured Carboxylicivirga sp.]
MKKILILAGLLMTLSLFEACSSNDTPTPDEPQINEEFYDEPFGKVPSINNIVMYEANERVFASDNSFNAITDRLDEIKSLGVNVLWLMPINEQGVENAIGSPYCIKNYIAPEPEYGTLDELRELVKQAHNKEIAVILDWVANHTSWDSEWVKNHKDWYTQDDEGNIIPPVGTNWSDVADLNYNNHEMRTEMISSMKYWVREANVDGFRCDAADWIPAGFWRDAIYELKNMQEGRTVLMLAEGTDPVNLQAGFDMDYGWNFCDALEGLYAGTKSISDIYTSHQFEYDQIPEGKQKLRFTTNHDRASENSPITKYNSQQGALSAYVISTTLGGIPLMYSSQEVGYSSTINFFNFVNVGWKNNQDINQSYQKIMAIYTSSEAFKTGALETFTNDNVMCFTRSSDEENILVIVNVKNTDISFTVPDVFVSDTRMNLMNDAAITIGKTITLSPYEFLILKKE